MSRGCLVRRAAALALGIGLLTGCDPEPLPARTWPALDTSRDVGQEFSPDFLVADADLEGGSFFGAEAVQSFLEKPPYGPPSFLAAYTERGRRASDLVAAAALRFRINALWLLARLQRDGGLVSARRYPFESKDVEYVFAYGCSGRLLCDPTFGGLAAQLDALAGEIRRTLDDLRRSGSTVNGFAKGTPTKTLDGVAVVPATDATAALYGIEAMVRGPGGGQALAWRIFRIYATHVGYLPLGPESR